MISVICPIYNEERYIAKCIDSILLQDYPQEQMELLFIDGMSSDKTRHIVNSYQQKYKFIQLLDNHSRTVPYALNIGIKAASGNIIIRLDTHAIYPKNYLSELVKKQSELQCENVGGICVTLPCDDTSVSKAIATAMSNGFGVGNSMFRIGAKEIRKVDTVPFGCFQRDLFEKIGMFDTDLTRNQDDEFNARIVKNGGTIYLLPELKIKYFARNKIGKVGKMFYQYGLFKPLVNKKIGSPATIRQFAPEVFVIGLVTGASLSLFSAVIFYLYISILVFYIGLSLLSTRKEIAKDPKQAFIFPIVFFTIHISYGWGYLVGFFKFYILNKKKAEVKVNR